MSDESPIPEPNPGATPRLARRAIVAAGVGVVVAAAAAGAFAFFRSEPAAPLLELFPSESYLVATLDMDALRKGPLGDLAGEGDAQARTRASTLLGGCADAAVAAVREVGLVVPGGPGDEGRFAFVARLDPRGTWLAACDAEVTARSATTPRETEGAWTYIGSKAGPRLAIHRSGIALWGREDYLHVLAAAVFRREAERRYPSLASRVQDGTRPIHAFAAISLPAEQRRAFASMVPDGAAGGAHTELFSIARAGLAATADGPNDSLEVVARFEVDDSAAIPELRTTVDKLVRTLAESREARALGVGDSVAEARVKVTGDAVVVSVVAPIARLRMMAKRLRLMGELRSLGRKAVEPAP